MLLYSYVSSSPYENPVRKLKLGKSAVEEGEEVCSAKTDEGCWLRDTDSK